MRILNTSTTDPAEIRDALTRTILLANPEKEAVVRAILDDVRARGDTALLENARRFDCPTLAALRVPLEEIDRAHAECDPELLATMRGAIANIEAFHRKRVPESWTDEFGPGVKLGQMIRPVEVAGVYAPGGSAAYPSTVLMSAVPARVAGVKRIILCSPAGKDGSVSSLVLAAAKECSITDVFAVGGAAAIAAMAFGTETVPRADVVCGPGSIYVLLAKKLVTGSVAIESLPGPSEICVVADEGANPRFVAADLLSQAEHGGAGAHSTAVLITTSAELAADVAREAAAQTESQPRREILRKALDACGLIIVTPDLDEAIELANLMAPEHLALEVKDPWALLKKARHAGAVMVGTWSTEPIADYWAGPSHVLPTGGSARFTGPLSVDVFLKKSSVVCYNREAMEAAAPHVIRFAEAEGLSAHANAVRVRLEGDE